MAAARLLVIVLGLGFAGAAWSQPKQANPAPRLILPIGDTGVALAAKFSPDGSRVLTGSDVGTAILWDAASGRELLRFVGHSGMVWSVDFSPDGARIATASSDKVARIWDARTGKEVVSLVGHQQSVSAIAFSPSGRQIATASDDKTARIWDAASGKEAKRLIGHTEAIDSVAFSSDGQRIVTGARDGTARIWDVRTGRELLKIDSPMNAWVRTATFSPDGTRIAAACGMLGARIWDATTGSQLLGVPSRPASIECVAFSPDGRTLASSTLDGLTTILDSRTGKEVARSISGKSVHSVTFSRSGDRLATGSMEQGCRIWDAATGAEIVRMRAEGASVSSLSFVKGGTCLACDSLGDRARILDYSTGRELARLKHPDGVLVAAAISLDGTKFAFGFDDGHVGVFGALNGKELLRLGPFEDTVWTVAFSADGKQVAAGSLDETARVWDVATGRPVAVLTGHTMAVWSVAFSPDGKRLATASPDGSARLWEINSGKEIAKFSEPGNAVYCVAFSPDGLRVAAGLGDHTARTLESATMKPLIQCKGCEDSVYCVDFSPDGKRLAVGSADETARVFDSSTGKEILRLAGHTGIVHSIVFSPDGNRLVSASEDGSIRFWNSQIGSELVALSPIGDNWACTTGDGWFDASPAAMRKMYWVLPNTLETIDLDQVKQRNWLPGLFDKVMRGEKLPRAPDFPMDRLQPVAIVGVTEGGTIATVGLTKRSGGFGAVKVYVNGSPVPVVADLVGLARSAKPEVKVDLKNFLVAGEPNTIEAVVSNADGSLTGRSVPVTLKPKSETRTLPCKLFVLTVGVGDYGGDLSSLRLPPKDALDFASAMRLAGSRLFGDRVSITVCVTGSHEDSTKANITKAFESIQAEASPQDAVVVFLAGHGVSFKRGNEGVYCFLTSEATTGDMSDPDVRARQAVSMDELVQWMVPTAYGKHGIRAQRRVLILDTCASGQAVANLGLKRDADPDQAKTLELFKDRTGFWVLAGSAADAVSYEAGQFGQGMLTYGLLEGMKGPGLEGDSVDVRKLFGFTQDEVEKLVQGTLGGVQRPQVFAMNQSFPIGSLSEADRRSITLASPKKRMLRPRTFTNTDPADPTDTFDLTKKLRSLLGDQNSVSLRGGRSLTWFVDADELAGAIVPWGNYRVEGDRVIVSFVLKVDDKPLGPPVTVESTVDEAKTDALARRVLDKMNELASRDGQLMFRLNRESRRIAK